jgi:thiamine pyrophosphokinase
MTTKRVFIFAGGNIDEHLLEEICEDDFIIGADRGALFLVEHDIEPNLAIGDFDSVTEQELQKIKAHSIEMMTCDAINKDLTDTELAYELAVEKQPKEIILVGATGTRLDQTLANIQMMSKGLQHQIKTYIVDKNNYITLIGSSCTVEERGFSYVSLLPLTPQVTGVTLEGFMYPLNQATLKMGHSLGVSNKLIGQSGTVHIDSGLLLIIQSKD